MRDKLREANLTYGRRNREGINYKTRTRDGFNCKQYGGKEERIMNIEMCDKKVFDKRKI